MKGRKKDNRTLRYIRIYIRWCYHKIGWRKRRLRKGEINRKKERNYLIACLLLILMQGAGILIRPEGYDLILDPSDIAGLVLYCAGTLASAIMLGYMIVMILIEIFTHTEHLGLSAVTKYVTAAALSLGPFAQMLLMEMDIMKIEQARVFIPESIGLVLMIYMIIAVLGIFVVVFPLILVTGAIICALIYGPVKEFLDKHKPKGGGGGGGDGGGDMFFFFFDGD